MTDQHTDDDDPLVALTAQVSRVADLLAEQSEILRSATRASHRATQAAEAATTALWSHRKWTRRFGAVGVVALLALAVAVWRMWDDARDSCERGNALRAGAVDGLDTATRTLAEELAPGDARVAAAVDRAVDRAASTDGLQQRECPGLFPA